MNPSKLDRDEASERQCPSQMQAVESRSNRGGNTGIPYLTGTVRGPRRLLSYCRINKAHIHVLDKGYAHNMMSRDL